MSGFANTRRLTVEWGHCDPAGIVFNPRFFEYFDYSTALLLEAALGARKAEITARYGIVGVPLVETTARFLAPCRYGDEVTIISTVTKLGRTSLTVAHSLHNGGLVSVEGVETRVWAARDPGDPARMRGVAIPDAVRERLVGI